MEGVGLKRDGGCPTSLGRLVAVRSGASSASTTLLTDATLESHRALPSCHQLLSNLRTTPFRNSMFSRLGQVARHLTRPLPNYAHVSAANPRSSLITSSTMAGTASTSGKGLIHTAACLIIGDEVLGGKVRLDTLMLAALTC